MKGILKNLIYFIFFIAFLAISYENREAILSRISPVAEKVVIRLGIKTPACAEPIQYTLGTFDQEFGISESYFLSAIAEAEMIWEEPSGLNLFVYAPESTSRKALTINLIYDYRQEATSRLASLGITVEETRASYDDLREKFTHLKARYTEAKAKYDTRIKTFNAAQDVYEQEVNHWNEQGGAPRPEYERLQAERASLDAQFKELQALQKEINRMVDEINAMVVVLNRLADRLNLAVEKYNTIGASRGESFTEGVYQSDGFSQQIDIYEFSNRDKLLRVLAHELGHALGLPHLDDPKAIMYEFNQGNTMALTDTDLEALRTKCGLPISNF